MFFAHDPDIGFRLFPTVEEAKAQAEAWLAEWLEECGGDAGSFNEPKICWGVVIQSSKITGSSTETRYDSDGDEYQAEVTHINLTYTSQQ
jgi:O-succinylbenzoate synthase